MRAAAFIALPFFFAPVATQIAWAPCSVYCYPQFNESVIDIQFSGACPPLELVFQASSTYYTSTCACYDYQITSGSSWTNCYSCVLPTSGDSTYQSTCLPNQPIPQPNDLCSQKADDISTACSVNNAIDKAISFLCDVTDTLTGNTGNEHGLSVRAKAVFAKVHFLIPGLARAALNVVDVGCQLYNNKYGERGAQLIGKGCDIWNQIGGCPADNSSIQASQSLLSGMVTTSTGVYTTVSTASGTPALVQATVSDLGPTTVTASSVVIIPTSSSTTDTSTIADTASTTAATASYAVMLRQNSLCTVIIGLLVTLLELL